MVPRPVPSRAISIARTTTAAPEGGHDMSGAHGRVLVIQIPCFNEEASLPATLSDLPRRMPGFERVEWLVVDDGSTDRTVEVARRHGVDHVVELRPHQGLARAFAAGLEAALAVGADVIVNTDADNQYRAADIPRLIAPILAGEADLVVGDRAPGDLEHFSPVKRLLQRIGSRVVRAASGTDVPDAPSGFRAMSREAALRTNVFGPYTYTLETIIQAGVRGLAVAHVPVTARPAGRPSRLYRSTLAYVVRQAILIVQVFAIYRPMRFFAILGTVPFAAGFLLGVRWLILFAGGTPRSHVPSLILGAILMLMGFGLWMLGFIAELQSVNRRILEEVQLDVRRRRYAGKAGDAARGSGPLGSSQAAE
jgi:glycosyltransferase involved in cell wall biosynthesis